MTRGIETGTEGIIRVYGVAGLQAIVIPMSYNAEQRIQFFTPREAEGQLAIMRHPLGHIISHHYHPECKREIRTTPETLFVRKGRAGIQFLDLVPLSYLVAEVVPIGSVTLCAGDVVLILSGGHGLVMLDDCEIIESKQGPYFPDEDKIII